jgi:hypothetical protein
LIYICIPTHNEQQTVGVVLWKLRQVLTDFPREYQLLVADDASTDKTPEVLEPYTRVLPLTVVRSDRRLGHGASLELLLREAVRRSEYPKRDIIVTLQADFSEEPDDLVPLIKRLEAGADVAVGNKVAKERASRTRRLARRLAGFFTRGQKWPEGVETPFDGYRAYRLHAVRSAMQERPGRLIRYDGWAANAELLRQVLPHTRRIDVLDVVDRTDRLQRPRRERPLAAALAVRSMSRGAAPADLVSIEELDSLAVSASRERVRAAEQVAQNGRTAARSNGGRARDTARPRDRGQAGEGRARSRSGRTQDATSDSPQSRRRQRDGQRREAAQERKSRGRGAEAPAAGAAVPTGADPDLAPETAAVEPGAQAAEAEAPRPRKRRRRRRKSGSGGAAAGATGVAEAAANPSGGELDAGHPNAAEPDGGQPADDEAGPAGEEDRVAGERKRRRRGGRRGGRGRRRAAGATGAGDADGADIAGGGGVADGGGGESGGGGAAAAVTPGAAASGDAAEARGGARVPAPAPPDSQSPGDGA